MTNPSAIRTVLSASRRCHRSAASLVTAVLFAGSACAALADPPYAGSHDAVPDLSPGRPGSGTEGRPVTTRQVAAIKGPPTTRSLGYPATYPIAVGAGSSGTPRRSMGIGATPVARDESYAATPRAVSNPGRGFASAGGATPQSVPAGGPLPWSIHQARMTASRGELRDAVATRDVEGARRSLTDLRQHQDEALIAGSAGQPVESRLCAPAVRTMYRKAASQVEEGLADGDDAKVRLGLERMDEGDRSLKSIRRN